MTHPIGLTTFALSLTGTLWLAAWLSLFVVVGWLATRMLRALVRTLPERGTVEASTQLLKCVVAALMVLYAMAYALPRLAGVHNVMAGVGGEQVIQGHAVDTRFALDSPASDVFGCLAGLTESVYAIMLTMGIQADLGGPIELTRDFLGAVGAPLPDLLTYVYSFVLAVMCAVAPVTLVAAALTQIRGLLLHWQHVLMRGSYDEVFLMSGLGDAEVALAKNTFETFADRRGERPLVIFCNVSSEMRDEHQDLIDNLRDLSRGSALFTHRDITDVLPDIENDARLLGRVFSKRFSRIRCFLLGDDYAANVNAAIDVIGIITTRAAQFDEQTGISPFDALVLDKDDDSKLPKDHDPSQEPLFARFEQAKADARRYQVFCLHDNQENELVFDSLAHGGTDDEGKGSLSAPVRLIRLSAQVRLVSRAREQAYDVLTRHPLYEVLDRPSYDTSDAPSFSASFMAPAPVQQLYVFVVGLGSYGTEVLKACYWMGRMRNVQLHLVGIDQAGDDIAQSLRVMCPEMMAERDDSGEPVVRIVSARAFTPAFDATLRDVVPNARIYAVVTLGDDQLNLNVALAMRRIFDDMLCTGEMKKPDDSNRDCAEFPIILPLINSRELFEAADRMTSDKNEAFRLEPFGMTDELFSYHNLVDSPWERRALAMNAAYREVWEYRPGHVSGALGIDATMDALDIALEYAEYEIKKLSNRTNVRHIPYRLWCMGADPADYLLPGGELARHEDGSAGIDLTLWRALLGYDETGAKRLMSSYKVQRDEAEDDPVVISRVRADQDGLTRDYPVVVALAALEHDRWLAFYRSEGWRDLTIEDCDRLVDLGLIDARKTHQSPKLRLHCYLCPNEELFDRGIRIKDDPYVYDRAAVLETPRILSEEILS